MWVSKKKVCAIEQRLADLEQKVNIWQARDPEESEKILKETIARFQTPNGAIRGNVLKSS